MKEQKAVFSLVGELNKKYSECDAEAILEGFIKDYKGQIALATSLSPEDQVLLHLIMNIDPKVKVFTLDTGRLFSETYDLIALTNIRYNCNIEVCFPDFKDVEAMVAKRGINLFYDSIESRKLCCRIRKVLPLKRALSEMKVWVCGLRRAQSVTRTEIKPVEWDSGNGLIKINPLVGWTDDQLDNFIRTNNIPINSLHKEGFTSIGCQPCTRATQPGEDIRAGRWWWENPETRECGLHK